MYFVHPQIKLNKGNFKGVFASFFRKPDLQGLEKKLAVYFPGKKIVFTDMGRSAFGIIIEKLHLENSSMLVPAYICDIFYPVFKKYNITPIFLDADMDTFNINLEELKKKLRQSEGIASVARCGSLSRNDKRIKSILVSHIYGLPNDMVEISKIAKEYNLKIIEDCAHSFGAKFDGKRWAQNSFAAKFCYLERDEEGKQKYLNRSTATEKMFLRSLTKSQLKEQNCSRKNFAPTSYYTGNFGDAALFSLYKFLPTFRGGMLVCPKDWKIDLPKTKFSARDFISFLNCFRFFAFLFKKFASPVAPQMMRKEKMNKPSQINNVSLNLFSCFINRYVQNLENRIELALYFQQGLRKQGFDIQESKNNVFCYVSVLMPQDRKDQRDALVKKLRKHKIFCTRMWHTPLILNPQAQKEYNINLDEFPNTKDISKRIINFPLQNFYTKKDIDKIFSILREHFSQY